MFLNIKKIHINTQKTLLLLGIFLSVIILSTAFQTRADVVIGEAGRTALLTAGSWTTINLETSYTNPIVFTMSNTENGGDSPKLMQVRSVGSSSFEIRSCEHENTDGGCDSHAEEQAGYVVFERDSIDARNGIEAGTVSLSGAGASSATTVSFDENLGTNAVIIATQQTQNESGEGIVQAVNVGATSADLYLCDHDESSVDSCESHSTSETVAWVAFDPNNFSLDAKSEVGATTMSDSTWTNQTFSNSYPSAPAVVGTVQNGGASQEAQPSMARNINVGGDQMDIRYCEHDSGGTCDTHASETVGWFAIRTGTFSIDSSGAGLTLTGNVRVDADLNVNGTIAKGSGSFVIDHPQDPENKLLYHSFVESPKAKNIYDGIVTLDKNGEATIQLPDYFEALNKDFRYQFMPIGEPAPNLHIKKEVQNNEFAIAGGNAGQEVSWQVTGIRHDPFIEERGMPTEMEKGPDALYDKGEYVHPGYAEQSEQ